MPINFPSGPSVGQLYTFSGTTWEWTSQQYWKVYSAQTGYITSVLNSGLGFSIINNLSSNALTLKTFSGESVTITDTGTQLNFSVDNYNAGVIFNYSGWTNNGNGTMNLPTVQVALYNNTDFLDDVRVYTVASGVTGSGGISGLTDNDTNYIYIDYNNGSPKWVVSTDNSAINGCTVVRFQNVYRIGNFLHNLEWGNEGAGLPNKIANRIDSVDRFARESGLSLGLSGSTGVVTLSSGVAWNGTLRQSLASVNSQDDIFFQNFHSGGTWVISTTADTLNNLYYDNGTDRVVASAGTYLVNWYYRGQEINDHLYEVWGNSAYTSVSEAQLSTQPDLPELITSHAFLLGRIIVQKNALTGFVETAFVTPFQSTTVQNHNDLTGLQGGSAGEYYHLNANQYNNVALTNVNNNFSASQTINADLNVTGDTTLNNLTANTISATTISGGTLYGDGSNLTNVQNIYNNDGVLTGNRTLSGASNDLTFADLNVFKTTSGGTDIGLKLDFANNIYTFGNPSTQNYSYIGVDDNLQIISIDARNDIIIGDTVANQNNTNLIINDTNQLIKTSNQGNDIGLKLDFANITYQFGQLTGINNSYIEIQNAQFAQYFNGNIIGIQSEPALGFYLFGDFNNINSGTSFNIDDSNFVISTSYGGNQNGIILDYSTDIFQFGKWNGGNSTYLRIEDTNQLIKTSNQGNDIGLKLDFANSTYSLGDFDNISGSTKIVIDDTAQTITLSNVSAATDSNVLTIDGSGIVHKRTYDYITGFTYNNNTFTIDTSSGNTFNATINTVTGLTVNGNLLINGNYTVTGDTVISGATVYSGDVTYNTNATVLGVLSASTFTGVYNSPLVKIGSAYTATTSNSTIEITGGTFNLTLYSSSGNTGRTLYIKNSGSGIVTILPNGSDTIESRTSQKLGYYEVLILQSDGVGNWYILNRRDYTIQFAHEWTTGAAPADNTTYYFGNFMAQQATTSPSESRQVIAMASGWATYISLMVSVAGTLATSEDSTMLLRNVTTSTSSTITTTLEHNTAAQLLTYTLATPLQITKGDVLEMRWTTPNWGTNPAAVRHVAQVLVN